MRGGARVDERRAERKQLKKKFRSLGISLLFQEALVWIVVIAYGIVLVVQSMLSHFGASASDVDKHISTVLEQSGWPMILDVLIAFILVLIYRNKAFFNNDLRKKNRRITVKAFTLGVVFVLGLNMVLSPVMVPVEWLLNLFGYTAKPSESILEGSTTWSMFLYTGAVGPIFEEFLYRGVVLRSLEKFGGVFAISISALLFGMMHGNIIQLPMAVGVGLIFGYLARRYSIWLTVLIHMANNSISELFSALPSNLLTALLYYVLFVLLLLVMSLFIYKKRALWLNWVQAWQSHLPERRIWLYFFTSIPMILLLVSNIVVTLLGLEKL
jgi:membrane protease YdiL (CAAX protease family)